MINWALFGSYLLSIILMIGLPIVLGVLVVRAFKVSWWIMLVGVGTFAIFQLAWTGLQTLFSNGTLPMPPTSWPTVVQLGLLSLLAVILENGIRWGGFVLLRKNAKPFGSSLAMGIGHGGAESIAYCILGILIPLSPVFLYNAAKELANGATTSAVQQMLAQISQFWAQPFYVGIIPGFQQIVSFSLQILLSILVWKALVNRNFLWFLLAIVYQTAFYLMSTYLGQLGLPSYVSIGILFLFLIMNVYLIYRFVSDETESDEDEDEDGEEDEDDEDVEDDEADEDNEEAVAGDEDEEDPKGDEATSERGGES